MRFFILIFAIFILNSLTYSQNFIYSRDNRYSSTPLFQCKCTSGFFQFSIGKNSDAGILMLQGSLWLHQRFSIAVPVYIFLTNGSKITVLDNVSNDVVDGQYLFLYSLSSEDMVKLQSCDIAQIRFSFKNETDSWTAEPFDYYDRTNDLFFHGTARDIVNLFKK
ncbi:MAG: hypothetical protein QM528_02455 [Phycisphaerales bacterium]|nr:hypothetical protein [Phycisphaerales bacterium]